MTGNKLNAWTRWHALACGTTYARRVKEEGRENEKGGNIGGREVCMCMLSKQRSRVRVQMAAVNSTHTHS